MAARAAHPQARPGIQQELRIRYGPLYRAWQDANSRLWWAELTISGFTRRTAAAYEQRHQAQHAVALSMLDALVENNSGSVPHTILKAVIRAALSDFTYHRRRAGNATLQQYFALGGQSPLRSEVLITVTSRDEDIRQWILSQGATTDTYGLDVEWRPTFRAGDHNPPALLQLATHNSCLIVQLLYLAQFPSELVELLADPRVRLVGKGVVQDCRLLSDDHSLTCNGTDDISTHAAQERGNPALRQLGLRDLCMTLLGWAPPRNKRVTMSGWDNMVLTGAQIEYAASDAWLSLLCYEAA